MPVTVGAVLSSYNYANQSSAANLKSQTLNLEKAGSSSTKPPAGKTLRTQDFTTGDPCGTIGTQIVTKCSGGGSDGKDPICKVCEVDQVARNACEQNCINQRVSCYSDTSGCKDVPACSKTCERNYSACINDVCGKIPNKWSAEGVHACPNLTQASATCGFNIEPPDEKSDCVPGDVQRLTPNGCIKRNGKYQCYNFDTDSCKWNTDPADCVNQDQASVTCQSQRPPAPTVGGQGGPTEAPRPTTPPAATEKPGGGSPQCTFCPYGQCQKCGPGSCKDGTTFQGDDCAPQQSCEQRAIEACGNNKDNVKSYSTAGFDVQKALKNFFGIFGF